MKTIYDVKQALDPELYVRQVEVWQAERRLREGRKYPDNLIFLSPPWADECQEEAKSAIPGPVKLAMAFAAAVLCLGLIALFAL